MKAAVIVSDRLIILARGLFFIQHDKQLSLQSILLTLIQFCSRKSDPTSVSNFSVSHNGISMQAARIVLTSLRDDSMSSGRNKLGIFLAK